MLTNIDRTREQYLTRCCLKPSVDLGCGSGLSGEEFRPCVGHLTGIDLNPEMAKEARDRGCYDRIVVGDAEYHEGILNKENDETEQAEIWEYDLVFACDLIAYIGGKYGC